MAVIQLLECRPLDCLVLLLEVGAACPAYLGRYGVIHVQRHQLEARDIDVLRLTQVLMLLHAWLMKHIQKLLLPGDTTGTLS